MGGASIPATERLADWLRRTRNALLNLALEPLESKVFRGALLTVLLISAVQQFVGWKYVGVVVREVVTRVQGQVLPWERADRVDHSFVRPKYEVAALLMGAQAEAGTSASLVEITPITLQRVLGKELQRFGALQIKPQPVSSTFADSHVMLRSEYIREQQACQPRGFDDIATLPGLHEADVVVIGGS